MINTIAYLEVICVLNFIFSVETISTSVNELRLETNISGVELKTAIKGIQFVTRSKRASRRNSMDETISQLMIPTQFSSPVPEEKVR